MRNINMYKHQYQVLAVLSCMQILNAASIHLTPTLPSITSTSAKPSTLLLPPGFDSELLPRQPMLYPFVVSTSTAPTHRSVTKQTLGPFITPGWIPISSSSNINNNYKEMFTLSPSSATNPSTAALPQPYPVPILEDRVSKYVLTSNDNGPVFESIVYGTWKPDPPLQPVEMLYTTTTMYSSGKSIMSSSTTKSVSDISDSTTGHSSTVIDGKVSNKTINRQHGGFIDNKQQNIISFEEQTLPRDSHELAVFVQSPNESTTLDNSNEPKQRKFVKKQGRQKIRPNSATKMTKTTNEMTTTPIESTEQSATETAAASATISDVVKLSISAPMEAVRQINDSIEIKYNHKQTSRHSIEVTAHERYNNHRFADHYEDLNDDDETDIVTAPTTSAEQQETDAPDDEDEGGSSVIRMNWPTDFMNTPLISSASTDQPLNAAEPSSQVTTIRSLEAKSSELPLALSSLNIPPSLWPKFPGNITKLGSPYAAESSLEEPALCVPITVQEHNMMNSHELVNIERVFCFPMPSTKIPRGFSKPTTSSAMKIGTGRGRSPPSPVIKANVHNFEDFYELNTSYVVKSHLTLVCSVLVVYFKYFY